MIRTAESAFQEAKIAELKRLITTRTFDSLETLEDAVDECLWGTDADNPRPTPGAEPEIA